MNSTDSPAVPVEPPLFQQALGDDWSRCPAAVRRLHTFAAEGQVAGRCVVERGAGVLSNWLATMVGFPKAAADLPVRVHFRRHKRAERWTRQFGDHIFVSTMRMKPARPHSLLCERIGLVNFAQALVVEDDRLHLVPRGWTLLGIPLPLWLAPRSNSYEMEQESRFHFHVEVSHPLLGLIVRYRGWLI